VRRKEFEPISRGVDRSCRNHKGYSGGLWRAVEEGGL